MMKNINTFWKEYGTDIRGMLLMFGLGVAAIAIRYASFFSNYNI